jgi:hypothetical protein
VRIGLITTNQKYSSQTCCIEVSDSFKEGKSGRSGIQTASCGCNNSKVTNKGSQSKKIFREILKTLIMVTKFMGFAFLIMSGEHRNNSI